MRWVPVRVSLIPPKPLTQNTTNHELGCTHTSVHINKNSDGAPCRTFHPTSGRRAWDSLVGEVGLW